MILYLLWIFLSIEPLFALQSVTKHSQSFRLNAVVESADLLPARKTIPLKPTSNDLNYLINVTVGTPPQLLSVIFDTGSADLVLWNRSLCNNTNYDAPLPCYGRNDSNTSLVMSPYSIGHFNLIIDGDYVNNWGTPVYNDTASITFDLVGAPAQETHRITAVFLLVNELSNHLPGFSASNGLMGSSYRAGSVIPIPWLQFLVNDTQIIDEPTFSLDLNPADNESTLYVGGIDDRYRDTLVWGESMSNNGLLNFFHSFNLFDLSTCGVNLFNELNIEGIDFSSGSPAIVDTASKCLNLPMEIFDAVVSRLPAACGYIENRSMTPDECLNTFQSTDYYVKDAKAPLPTLSFRVQKNGKILYLPLSVLLLPPVAPHTQPNRGYWPYNTQIPLCLERGITLRYGNQISFGNRVLRAFFVTLVMNTHQVGFANKLVYEPSNLQCGPKPPCTGMQTYSVIYNTCEDPPCSQYYFFQLDNETKSCTLTSSFHAVCITIGIIFLIVQLGFNEIHEYLSGSVVRNIEEI